MPLPARSSVLLLAAGLSALAPTAAHGQQEYRLDADDAWQAGELPEPGSPERQVHVARRALATRQYERAEMLATEWIERYPTHPLLPEAYLLRADALRGRGDYYLALFDYEFVARTYAGSEVFVAALQHEYEIARLFAGGLKRKLWGLRIVDASSEAEELFIRVQERLPGSRLAENAAMSLADFYFIRRDMALAAEMYEIFIENHPRSERIGKARKRLIYAHLASFKGPEFDGAGLAEAREGLLALKATDPVTAQKIGADALLTRIDESEARKMLVTAQWYLKTNDVIAAELTIRRLIRRFPTTVASSDALRSMATILPRLPRSVLEEAPDYEGLLSPPDESPALDQDPDPAPRAGERER